MPKTNKKVFKIEDVYVSWTPIGQGILLYHAWEPKYPAPIGFVWGMPRAHKDKGTFDVFGSFVQTWARRHGVRTKINEQILKHSELIITSNGTKEGGAAFLKASGYKLNKAIGLYFLERKQRARKRG